MQPYHRWHKITSDKYATMCQYCHYFQSPTINQLSLEIVWNQIGRRSTTSTAAYSESHGLLSQQERQVFMLRESCIQREADFVQEGYQICIRTDLQQHQVYLYGIEAWLKIWISSDNAQDRFWVLGKSGFRCPAGISHNWIDSYLRVLSDKRG